MIAEEIMTRDVRTIPMSATVAAAVEALHSAHARHLPVVDDRGILVGMVSDRDLGALMKTFIVDEVVERMPYPPEQRSLADLMSTEPFAVHEDDDVAEVIDTLVNERIGAVPVVDNADRVIGIISYIDVLVALRPKETEVGGGGVAPGKEETRATRRARRPRAGSPSGGA